MHEWIQELGPRQFVLDLGAGAGSLKAFEYSCSVVCVDSDKNAFAAAYDPHSPVHRIVAFGQALPFADASFDLVLCHHVLEHITELSGTLLEISRVLKPDGRLYVTVPNGYGLCDGIYRYVFEGGEHVNRFRKQELASLIETTVGVRMTAWQKLYSSFAYLSRIGDLDPKILPSVAPRLRRVARLPRAIVVGVQGFLYLGTRVADRMAGVDWALYGWALYFERTGARPVQENPPFVNVCLYCGSGHPAAALQRSNRFMFRCPTCNHAGLYFPPFRNAR